MLTSSNQYLRPDYLSPLPTTVSLIDDDKLVFSYPAVCVRYNLFYISGAGKLMTVGKINFVNLMFSINLKVDSN